MFTEAVRPLQQFGSLKIVLKIGSQNVICLHTHVGAIARALRGSKKWRHIWRHTSRPVNRNGGICVLAGAVLTIPKTRLYPTYVGIVQIGKRERRRRSRPPPPWRRAAGPEPWLSWPQMPDRLRRSLPRAVRQHLARN